MKKNTTFIIKVLLIGLGILLLGYFAFFNNGEVNRYQWTENYKATSDQPYGTQFIQKLLASQRKGESFFNDKTSLTELLGDTNRLKTKTDYVFVGYGIYLDEDDTQALLDFISAGNDAFIAAMELPEILNSILPYQCQLTLQSTDTLTTTHNFYNDNLKSEKGYSYRYRFSKIEVPYRWKTLYRNFRCDSVGTITPIGYIQPNHINFFRVQYGKGNLYVHTNPLVFTNYFMTKGEKAEYASSAFSHLKGESMIWDEFSKSQFIPNNAPRANPMAYILQQDSLKYAWWLMLIAVILYTLFTAKRKQKIIPVIEPKANTSLEFVNMISVLHFENANHRDIARKRIKYFFHFVKTKYGMHAQHLSELNQQRLAEKSKVAAEDIKQVANELDRVDKHKYYDDTMLVDLQIAMEKFYKNCK